MSMGDGGYSASEIVYDMTDHESKKTYKSLRDKKKRKVVWRKKLESIHTLACRAPWSRFLNSARLASRSSLRSGNFSTLVLLRRLTIGFSRCSTCMRLT